MLVGKRVFWCSILLLGHVGTVFVCLRMLTVFILVLDNGAVSKMDQEQMRKQRRH